MIVDRPYLRFAWTEQICVLFCTSFSLRHLFIVVSYWAKKIIIWLLDILMANVQIDPIFMRYLKFDESNRLYQNKFSNIQTRLYNALFAAFMWPTHFSLNLYVTIRRIRSKEIKSVEIIHFKIQCKMFIQSNWIELKLKISIVKHMYCLTESNCKATFSMISTDMFAYYILRYAQFLAEN